MVQSLIIHLATVVECKMKHGSKLQRKTWFLESLEPIGFSLVRNNRTAKKVMTFSLREMKGEEGKKKKDRCVCFIRHIS